MSQEYPKGRNTRKKLKLQHFDNELWSKISGWKVEVARPYAFTKNVQILSVASFAKQNSWSRYKERRVDALALRADEGRDKLRKASERCK